MGDVPSKEEKRGNMGQNRNQVSQAEVHRLRDQVNRLQREQQRLQQNAQQNQAQMQQYQALRPHLEAMQHVPPPPYHGSAPPYHSSAAPYCSRTTIQTDVIHQTAPMPMNTGAVPRRGGPRGRGQTGPQPLLQQNTGVRQEMPARGGRGRGQQQAAGGARHKQDEWGQGRRGSGGAGDQGNKPQYQQQEGRGRGRGNYRGGRGGNRGMRAGKSMDSLQFAGKEQFTSKDFVDTMLTTPNNTPDTHAYSLAKLEQALNAFAGEAGSPGIGLEQLTRALQNLTENAPDKQTPEKSGGKKQQKLNNDLQATEKCENKQKPLGKKSVSTVKNNLLEGFDLLDECNSYFNQKVGEVMPNKNTSAAEEEVVAPYEDASKLRARFLEVPQDEMRRSLPPHWVLCSFPMVTQHVTPLLDPDSMDFVELTNAFKKTAPTLSVKRIMRLENAFLWLEFRERKRRLTEVLGGEPEERQLYHGPRDLEAVLESGFGWTYQHRPRPKKYNHRIALTSYAGNACQHCRDTHKVVVAVSLQGSRDPLAAVDLLTGEPESSTEPKNVLSLLDDYSSYPAYIIEWEGDLPPPGPKQTVKQQK
ncbi:hypothetical protein B566_EDAN002097 [Ephemera danica]|nr:hypothetical protein B566_EDAN002097 [Ephemera danica]